MLKIVGVRIDFRKLEEGVFMTRNEMIKPKPLVETINYLLRREVIVYLERSCPLEMLIIYWTSLSYSIGIRFLFYQIRVFTPCLV